MKVCLREVPPEEKETLFHLLEKYSYEFSQYDQTSFDDKGLFGYPYLDLYFTQRIGLPISLRRTTGLPASR